LVNTSIAAAVGSATRSTLPESAVGDDAIATADGDANNHRPCSPSIPSGIWKGVHVGQFAGSPARRASGPVLRLDVRDATARWTGRFGAASGIVALALYGAPQAADGVGTTSPTTTHR
jgi:hypothetical protein